MKRGKKILSIFQINLLIISLFAFCFIINLNSVNAEITITRDGKKITEAEYKKYMDSQRLGEGTSTITTPVSTGKFPKGVEAGDFKFNNVRTVMSKDPSTGTSGLRVQVKDTPSSAWRFANNEEIDALINDKTLDENFEVKGEKSFLAGLFTAQEGGFTAGILSGLEWASAVVGVLGVVGGLLPGENEWVNSATIALGVGAFLYGGLTEWNAGNDFVGGDTGAAVISIAASAIVFYLLYKDIETEMITFTCSPWDAPAGGMYCEKCNEQNLPCSEYQCRSLGQACELINPGTDEAKCVWVNKNDVTFPIIKPWDDALSDGYAYSPDSAINPPDSGVQILHSKKECVGAFEKLSFGVILDEPAKCKIDYLRKNNFDEMSFYFGGSPTLKYNHTQTMSLPGSNSEENLTLKNDGNYELYVRCQDANGNYNKGNFVFKYCVDAGPDTTAPLIVTTNVLNGMPVKYNEDSLDLEVYINEPAQCKWSHSDQQYDDMEETMSCSSSITEMNSRQLYKCETTLTGLKNDEENNFYFKCKDQPTKPESERNTNAESYEFTLIGTQPLVISVKEIE